MDMKEQAQAIEMNRLNNGRVEFKTPTELTFQKLKDNNLNAEQEDFMIESKLEMIRENRENEGFN